MPWWNKFDASTKTRGTAVLRTIAALYDDTIDTEHALAALRKSGLPAEQISVILRERVLATSRDVTSDTSLSRVIAASALDAVSNWLRGLATLILSDRAAYLVAGPFGVVLASIRDTGKSADEGSSETAAETDLVNRQLVQSLEAFGFSPDESGYIEQRIVAGSPLIAITSSDVETLRSAHEIFNRHSAVHLGLSRTERSIGAIAAGLLELEPHARSESVMVADAASPLRRLTDQPLHIIERYGLIGTPVFDINGTVIGFVEDALIKGDILQQDRGPELRYLVVLHRARLGLDRWRVAVPLQSAEIDVSQIRLTKSLSDVTHAPRYSSARPLSLQEEGTIQSFFNVMTETEHGPS